VRQRSVEKYSARAADYDASCGPTWPIRERAVALLGLQPGERVLDVGCGTGLSIPLLRQRVGEDGAVIGFDHSAAMLAQARARAAAAGWRNVTLAHCAAQELATAIDGGPVDAILFHYTHDILRSPTALAHVLACARPGAHVAIAGIKYFPWWLAPLNLWVYYKNFGYNGAPGELTTPWDRIATQLTDWTWTPTQYGMGYLASGRLASRGEGSR
jgi:demethylmenaquinone methyltransferase/2-methoxy-6-polyprenyl-1,4-benzoquinol methylase